MKKIIACVIVMLIFSGIIFADTYVNGYYKKSGTYVEGYYRSDSNNSVKDNWSYKGNVNPYTNEDGTNYYKGNKSSEYYEEYKDKGLFDE